MYNVGVLSGAQFRSEFPPGTDCFELSLKVMLENDEIRVSRNAKDLDSNDAVNAFDSSSGSADLSNIEVRLTPIGRNVALGGKTNTDKDDQELLF
jgi:hypothetical protein